MVNQRLQQLLNDDDAGDRITGNTQNGCPALAAQDGGLAGLHGNAVVEHFTQFPDDPGGIVVTACRGTGIENHQVALLRCPGYRFLNSVELIGHDGVNLCLRAPLPYHGGENRAVEFQDITGLGICTGRNDLITGGDNANQRLSDHLNLQHAAGDHGADGSGRHLHMGRQDHFTGTDILADLADMLPGSGRGMDGYGTVFVLHHILHHNDGVAFLRNRIAGIQHDKLAGLQRDGGGFSGTEGILCLHANAIHGAGRIVGRADVGIDRMGRDPAAGIPCRNHLCPRTVTVAPEQIQIVFSCLRKRNIGQIFKSHIILLQLLEFQRIWEGLRSPGQCRNNRLHQPGW